ncbi:hypothetical protein D9M70_500350 [compost metagenome]
MASRRLERSVLSLIFAEILAFALPCNSKVTFPVSVRPESTALVRASALTPVSLSTALTAAATSLAVAFAAMAAVSFWPSGPVTVMVVAVTPFPAAVLTAGPMALANMVSVVLAP